MATHKFQFHQALLAAFPSRGKLATMLGQRFGVLYAVLTPEDALDVEYWTVIEQVSAEGWFAELVRAAFETVPRNEKLASLAMEMGLTSVSTAAGRATAAAGPVLERMIREGGTLIDLPEFLARLVALEGQTCRIETADRKAIGTGFLVGPDLVMTNHHVIAPYLGNGPAPLCRFDYCTDAAGIEVRRGTEAALADEWHVISRPHDPADLTPDENDLPAGDMLDFAVLRLKDRLGEAARQGATGPDNPPRGWVGIDPALTTDIQHDLYVLQHPLGTPLKLATGRVTKLIGGTAGGAGGSLRLRYDGNTEPGSSGAPVLDARLSLLALHHVGDPNAFRIGTFNQAIPMARIIAWLHGRIDPFWETRP